ncbi:putative membrane protein [Roseibium hamelinense]|uniref:Putative membrane protein n=1 Tax=Roseibium hamelinense TaxID=150831 RepID=A0A562T1S8_9HYPH|nr:AzlD domain-containing protein [Roseibium hamelinense]MTI43323.1 AzlD domain-containing protein [Roseibium hamelinense]TWI87522.1 putative membrane protein [Roseibium hamelinense]
MTEALFSVDAAFFAVVLAMTAATYAMRAGGYWVMGRIPITPRIRRGLESLPGAIIVSTILPIALKGGVSVMVCLALAAAVMAAARKEFIAVFAAMIAVAMVRSYSF